MAGANHDYLELFVKHLHVRVFRTHYRREYYSTNCNNESGGAPIPGLFERGTPAGNQSGLATFYCLGDTAIRSRLATGRPSLNAGMNFHVKAARMRSGSTVFTFPVGSAE